MNWLYRPKLGLVWLCPRKVGKENLSWNWILKLRTLPKFHLNVLVILLFFFKKLNCQVMIVQANHVMYFLIFCHGRCKLSTSFDIFSIQSAFKHYFWILLGTSPNSNKKKESMFFSLMTLMNRLMSCEETQSLLPSISQQQNWVK